MSNIIKNCLSKLYEIFWLLGKMSGCHQIPSRSFFIKNRQFPVCARCTGCFTGYIIGIPLFFVCKIPFYICIPLCLIMLADWLIQYFQIKESTNLRRFLTGLLCGVGYVNIFLMILIHILSLLQNLIYQQ